MAGDHSADEQLPLEVFGHGDGLSRLGVLVSSNSRRSYIIICGSLFLHLLVSGLSDGLCSSCALAWVAPTCGAVGLGDGCIACVVFSMYIGFSFRSMASWRHDGGVRRKITWHVSSRVQPQSTRHGVDGVF